MLVREEEQLDSVKTEIFDLLVGYDDERNIEEKRTQSARLLSARRAIEQRREEREISPYLNEESWFE